MSELPNFKLLMPWTASQQKKFINTLPRANFGDGEIIFEKGDASTDVYFIIYGGAKSLNYGSDGKISYFRMREPGDCLGYYSAISEEPRTATMIAVGDTEMAKMSGPHFFSLVLSEREIGRNFLKLVVGLLRVETSRLANITMLPTYKRLAAELFVQCGDREHILLRLPDRDDFASYLGMTRETLSRALSELSKRRLIKLDKEGVQITNASGLRQFIEEEP